MKTSILLTITATLLLTLTACSGSEPLHPGFHAEEELQIIIPETYQDLTTRVAADPDGTCRWEPGDKVYIGILYRDAGGGDIETQKRIATRTTDNSNWQFDDKLYPPDGTNNIRIQATYIGQAIPGEVVASAYLSTDISHNLSNGNTITLDRFVHQYSCIIFTDLNEGDVVRLENENGIPPYYLYLMDTYLNYRYNTTTRPTFTAGPDGTATAYGEIHANATAVGYSITRGGTIKTGTFDPGTTGKRAARRYTIYCAEHFPGPASPADIAKDSFLAYATDIRAGNNPGDFTLMADIDLSDVEDFRPITFGNSGEFNNTFDGNGFTISGLKIEGYDGHAALFYRIGENGVVKNLTLKGPKVTTNYDAAGIAVRNYGEISHCTLTDAEIENSSGNHTAGGIVGWNYGSLTHCTSTGSVKGNTAGGIAGTNTKDSNGRTGSITACHSDGGTIVGSRTAGGIAGSNANGATIAACHTGSGVSISDSDYAGGIVGYNNSARVTACYSLANAVTGTDRGGIAGENDYGATITTCHWLTGGTNRPTNAVGSTTGGATATGCESFTSLTQFNNNNLMGKMNTALNAAGITTVEWETATSGYPTIKIK